MAHGLAITRTGASGKDLRAIAARMEDADLARRLLAIALAMEGVDRATASRSCGMDRQTLRDWVRRYNKEGVEGLYNRTAAGPSRRLNEAQMQELAAMVEDGPDLKSDGVVRWRRIDLKEKIEKTFGVVYHERSVGKLLATLGYVRMSVRPQHPKSRLKTQEAFKKSSLTRSASISPKRRAASRSKFGSKTKPASASKAR
jgi:transposase